MEDRYSTTDENQGEAARLAAILLAALLVVGSQGLGGYASAQEVGDAGAPRAQPVVGMEMAPDDQPKFARRTSVERVERRGRAMLGTGVASLSAGAALFVTEGVLLANGSDTVGMLFTAGGALLVTGAILTPLGLKRMKWARRQTQRGAALSLTLTGVLIRGSF